jgi:hypothetical protein
VVSGVLINLSVILSLFWSVSVAQVGETAKAAIKRLWSASETERQAGKEKLLNEGLAAESPLIALLEDLLSDRRPRFATGNEAEGAETLKRVLHPPENKGELGEGAAALERLVALDIKPRLIKDAVELLVRMNSENAFSMLVHKVLVEDDPRLWPTHIETLAAMGPWAVPKLIEILERPEDFVGSTRFPSGNTLSDQEKKNNVIRLRLRIVETLGRIGDIRALPTLTALKCDGDPAMCDLLQKALDNIANRTK